jgi:hypothetical protein
MMGGPSKAAQFQQYCRVSEGGGRPKKKKKTLPCRDGEGDGGGVAEMATGVDDDVRFKPAASPAAARQSDVWKDGSSTSITIVRADRICGKGKRQNKFFLLSFFKSYHPIPWPGQGQKKILM